MISTEIVVSVLSVLLFCCHVIASPEALLCKDEEAVKSCIGVFDDYLEAGIEIFVEKQNDTFVDDVCRKYEVTINCMSPYMHRCTDVRNRYKPKLEKFEYACTADRTGTWPRMPVPNGENETTSSYDAGLTDSAIKAGIAASVTFILILMCATVEFVSKWRVRQHVKRVQALSQANNDQAALMKKSSSNVGIDVVDTKK